MAATYPSESSIQSWAAQNGANPDDVGTYVAANARLPANLSSLANWILQLDGSANWPGGAPQADIDAFVQQHRGPARSQSDATQWFQTQGMLDASGNWTSLTLPALYFYDQLPGVNMSGAVEPSGTPTPTASGPNLDVSGVVSGLASSLTTHPILWGGGAAVAVGAYFLLRKR